MKLSTTYAELQANYIIEELDSESWTGLWGEGSNCNMYVKQPIHPVSLSYTEKVGRQWFYKAWQTQLKK